MLTFTQNEEDVLFALTLSWCENIHAVEQSLTAEQVATAEALAPRMDAASEAGEGTLADVLSILLTHFVQGWEESDLSGAQWEALEALHGRLSRERGSVPRRLDGTVIEG